MGIVNITDNSYYECSRCLGSDGGVQVSNLLSRAATMIAEGADIIDVGACSTAPGTEPVSISEEWRRLLPALDALREAFPSLRISVDTVSSEIVRKTHDLIGDFIVNDISAGEDDPQMLSAAASLGLEYVAMHKKGTALTMQSLCTYDDVVSEVRDYFVSFGIRASEAGLKDWIIDPGFGFAKTVEQNYELLGGLAYLCELGRKVLVGVSRKSMIYKPLGITPQESLPATQLIHLKALEAGASILRVHDVAEAARTVKIWRMLR